MNIYDLDRYKSNDYVSIEYLNLPIILKILVYYLTVRYATDERFKALLNRIKANEPFDNGSRESTMCQVSTFHLEHLPRKAVIRGICMGKFYRIFSVN